MPVPLVTAPTTKTPNSKNREDDEDSIEEVISRSESEPSIVSGQTNSTNASTANIPISMSGNNSEVGSRRGTSLSLNPAGGSSFISSPDDPGTPSGGAVALRKNNSGIENSGTNNSTERRRKAIRKQGSRLVLAGDAEEKKQLEKKASVQKSQGLSPFLMFIAGEKLPWLIRPTDSDLETSKRVTLADHLLNSLLVGIPFLAVIALGVSEAADAGASLPVTVIVSLVVFILMTILPWAFWIGVNVYHDREYDAALKKHQADIKELKTGYSSVSAALLDKVNQRKRKESSTGDKLGSFASRGHSTGFSESMGEQFASLNLADSNSNALSGVKYTSSESNAFANSNQKLNNSKEAKTTTVNNTSFNNKNANNELIQKRVEAKMHDLPPRPPLPTLPIDILSIIMILLALIAGICWKGISICMLIVAIRIFARASLSADFFVITKIEVPIVLCGGIYLLVKGAQEAGMIDGSVAIIADTAFTFAPSSAQNIIALVSSAIQLLLLTAFVAASSIVQQTALSHLEILLKGKAKGANDLTHAEQHVAGGIIGNLVRLEITGATKIAEKYISAESPTMLRGLKQLISNMESYMNFVPNWVKNPNAVEEEDEDEETESDAMQQSSEVWSSSHNESIRSTLNSSINNSVSNSNLTAENMRRIAAEKKEREDNNAMFGEYNLDYENEGDDDDDITSVREGDLADNNKGAGTSSGNNRNSGSNNNDGPKGQMKANHPGFSGKVVLGSLQFELDFKKYAKAKQAASFHKNPLNFALPNSIPDSSPSNQQQREASPPENNLHYAGGGGGGATNDDPTQTDIEKKVIDKICSLIQSCGAILHSIVANQVTVSWNTMSRIAAPEHKAARFLVLCRKIATDKDSEFPGLKITGACMTGYGRALISTAGSTIASVVCVRWWKELQTLAALAAQEDTIMCDLATKHAVFLEFSVRGCGCLGNKALLEIPKNKANDSMSGGIPNKTPKTGGNNDRLHHPSAKPASSISPRMSSLSRTKNNSDIASGEASLVNTSNNNNTNVLGREPSMARVLSSNSLEVDPSHDNIYGKSTPGSEQKQQDSHQHQQHSELLAIFSIIGRRTGNNVEWMYLLQGGDEDSGNADPAAVSCSAMDHAAAGNFSTAKQYIDQAIALCEKEASDLKLKIDANVKGNGSMTQRQRDEADLVEEQEVVNKQSWKMFLQLTKRLDGATMETFPYKLAVV